jgi:hypothetical protein
MKTRLFTLLIVVPVLFSCKKESTQSGNGTLAYRYNYEYPLEISPAGFMDRIVLEDVNPYSDIMGHIATSLSESKTDGKPTKFSDIQVSGVRLSTAFVHVSTQSAFVHDHLTGSKIVLKDFTASTATEKRPLRPSAVTAAPRSIMYLQLAT